jgi:outer membrane immunogenic protein
VRKKLISSLAGAAFSFAASGFAFAADMAVKAPPPAPEPALNWTGWYIGLNAGAGLAQNDSIENRVTSSFCNRIFSGCNRLPVNSTSTALAAGIPTHFDIDPDGFIGGGQIGYNWQLAPQWVAGIEADFQGTTIKDSSSGPIKTVQIACCLDANVVTGTGSQKLEWFGTVRGRLGWLLTQPLLLYATGGLAYGHVETSTSFSATGGLTPEASRERAPPRIQPLARAGQSVADWKGCSRHIGR